MYRHVVEAVALCCLVLALPALPSRADAQEPAIGSAEVVKSESFLCRKLAMNPDDTAQRGYLKMLSAPKGKAFLVVWTRLKLSFGKNEDGEEVVYIADEHMSLKDSKGNVSHVVGNCTRDGRYRDGSGWISHYKEYLEGDEVNFNPVFVVPAGEQEFTLQIAGAAHKFTAPMQIADTIDRTRAATFKIDEVKVIDNLSKTRSLRQYEEHEVEGVTEEVLAPATRYLAVRILIKPTMPNDGSGNFYVYSNQFGLRYGAQVYATPVGYFDGRHFYDGSTGEGDEPDAAGEFPAQEMHLVFPLPGKLTTFRAMYMMQEFGGAAIPQE